MGSPIIMHDYAICDFIANTNLAHYFRDKWLASSHSPCNARSYRAPCQTCPKKERPETNTIS